MSILHKARVNLYKNCKILPEKNFCVDEYADYLSTLEHLYFTDCQWVQPKLEFNYKLQLNQEQAVIMKKEANYNYAEFMLYEEDTEQERRNNKLQFQCFILDKKWVSENCIELKLKVDVLNTFREGDRQFDYKLSQKTLILREHKNRWEYAGEVFTPKIDIYSEGIAVPLFKEIETPLYRLDDTSFEVDGNSYYLIYRARDEGTDKPMDIFFCADYPMKVARSTIGFNGKLNPKSELGSRYGAIIYANDSYNGHNNIGCEISFRSEGRDITLTLTASNQCILIFSDMICKGVVSSSGFQNSGGLYVPGGFFNFTFKEVNISSLNIMRIAPRGDIRNQGTWGNITPTYITSLSYATKYVPASEGVVEVGSIYDIDISDPQLMRIIKFPYSPINITYHSDGTVGIEGTIEQMTLTLNMLKLHLWSSLDPLETNFMFCDEDGEIVGPHERLKPITIGDMGSIVVRNPIYETKLLHSDFFTQKIVYDSFSYEFKAEYMPEVDGPQYMVVEMISNCSCESAFYFSFGGNGFVSGAIETEDYANLMPVNRGNEVALINSGYLNYVRNGYNFDIKTRNRQLAQGLTNLGLGFVGGIANLVFGKGENKSQGIANFVVGEAKSGSALAFQTAQNDQSLAEALRRSAIQGASIQGTTDLSLMSKYTDGNKAKFVVYKPSEKMSKVLFDLFYYTGYIANYQGVPNTNTRMLFNFIQADIVFDTIPNIPEELVDEIRLKYKEGFTRLHMVEDVDIGQTHYDVYWDFEQQYENWEKSLI